MVTVADDGNPRAQQAIDFSVDDIVYIIALTAIQATPSLTHPMTNLLNLLRGSYDERTEIP